MDVDAVNVWTRTGAMPKKPHRTRPKPAYHHGNLREALVGAAIEILEAAGAGALSLRAVARRAGVSQTAPYRHFADKEALLAAIAAEGFRRKRALQAEAIEHARPGETLMASGRGYVAFGRQNPALLKLMFGPDISDWSRYPELVQASRTNYQALQDAVAAGLPPDSPLPAATVAAAAWSLVHGLTMLMADGRLTAEDAGAPNDDALIDRVLHSLGWPPAR